MPTILIAEPVPETRELLIRLAGRQGWSVLSWPAIAGDAVDVLLYEPLSRLGREARDHVHRHHPRAGLVAVTVSPNELEPDHGADHLLAQPFAPNDLLRVLQALRTPQPQPAAA